MNTTTAKRLTEMSVEEYNEGVIARAIKFSAFIAAGGQRFHEDFETLAEAGTCARQYEAICAHHGMPEKRALVYAVDVATRTVMVPRAQWTQASGEI